MPEISVIVPVYKAEKFLRKCTQSILSQSFTDIEMILVEDGSPDSSGALCDVIAAEDHRVRVFHKPNGGVSSARNLGMKMAKGRFIAFADSDDWLPEGALEAMYRAAQEAGADSAGGAHHAVEVSGESTYEAGPFPAGVYGKEEIRTGIVDRLLGYRLGGPGEVLNGFIWRFLFSTSIIRDNGIVFDGAYLEDELFLLEYFCHAEKLAVTDASVYCYLQNPVSVTRQYLPDYVKTFRNFVAAKEKVAERYGLGDEIPLWRESTLWNGLLIAVGNEYAPGNPASMKEKTRRVRQLCEQPDMAQAIRTLQPKGIWKNKQIVADLICKRQYFLLSCLYRIKNRGRV